MPVFSRVRDGVLVLTVDGDYTANELRRVGFGAFEAQGTPKKRPARKAAAPKAAKKKSATKRRPAGKKSADD